MIGYGGIFCRRRLLFDERKLDELRQIWEPDVIPGGAEAGSEHSGSNRSKRILQHGTQGPASNCRRG